MNTLELLIDTVEELVDVDTNLNADTTIEEMGLVSLDYIEIQVVLKKTYGMVMNAELFESGKIKTLGDFAKYIDTHKEKSPELA